MSAAAISSVIELAPTVLQGIETIANDVSSDTAAHKTVVQTATDALGSALTSVSAIATSGSVGKNDAANIQTGVAAITAASAAVGPITEAFNLLKELLSHL
jgi:hypothetical protein